MNSEKRHERLADAPRHKQLSATEALEILRADAGFQDHDRAEFHVGCLRLLSGDRVGLPDIRFDSADRDSVCCVSVSASTHFEAIQEGYPFVRRFEINLLDQARIDGHGRITLRDGRQLRALNFELAQLPIEPSALDWRIVHLTLEFMKADHCYRSLQDGCTAELREMVPDVRFLDLTRFGGLNLPPLRDITRFIASKYKRVSSQQIANSLRKFGIRHPQKRPG